MTFQYMRDIQLMNESCFFMDAPHISTGKSSDAFIKPSNDKRDTRCSEIIYTFQQL